MSAQCQAKAKRRKMRNDPVVKAKATAVREAAIKRKVVKK
jgi:hypothetical protein